MTDVSTDDPVEAELRAVQDEVRERRRLQDRAAEADRLELELAAERAGLPEVKMREVFLARWEGPPDPRLLRIEWAEWIGDDSWLSRDERLSGALTKESRHGQ